jgi:hypothetical protein
MFAARLNECVGDGRCLDMGTKRKRWCPAVQVHKQGRTPSGGRTMRDQPGSRAGTNTADERPERDSSALR